MTRVSRDMTSKSALRTCARCVMNTSLIEVSFNGDGICNFCRLWDEYVSEQAKTAGVRKTKFERLIARIKRRGRGKPYDCILGVSGGVDSSYVALKARELGLRTLAVHFDNGWNTELAVGNIERLCKALSIDLRTYVVDWDEFRDVQLSFLKASVRNLEAPSDHAIFAALHRTASETRVKYILNGNNAATEFTVVPRSFGHSYRDARQLRAIHREYGTGPLRTFPVMGWFLRPYYSKVLRIESIRLLDEMNERYMRNDAIGRLTKEVGWRPYTGKHHESIITRFHQCYVLPRRFGVDKRLAHLSNLIHSGQLTREDALRELSAPACPPDVVSSDKQFVAKKFGLSEWELDKLIDAPEKPHTAYANEDQIEALRQAIGTFVARLRRS